MLFFFFWIVRLKSTPKHQKDNNDGIRNDTKRIDKMLKSLWIWIIMMVQCGMEHTRKKIWSHKNRKLIVNICRYMCVCMHFNGNIVVLNTVPLKMASVLEINYGLPFVQNKKQNTVQTQQVRQVRFVDLNK